MNSSAHLPDDLLQACAAAAAPAEAAAHLRTCPQCQAQVRHYQVLFAALAAAPRPAFEFDLAAAVLAQLPAPALPPRRVPVWVLLLALLLPLVTAPVVWFWSYFAGLFAGAAPRLLLVLLPTAAALLLLLVGERLLTHQRQLTALPHA